MAAGSTGNSSSAELPVHVFSLAVSVLGIKKIQIR